MGVDELPSRGLEYWFLGLAIIKDPSAKLLRISCIKWEESFRVMREAGSRFQHQMVLGKKL